MSLDFVSARNDEFEYDTQCTALFGSRAMKGWMRHTTDRLRLKLQKEMLVQLQRRAQKGLQSVVTERKKASDSAAKVRPPAIHPPSNASTSSPSDVFV
jgi:hypothetical protein